MRSEEAKAFLPHSSFLSPLVSSFAKGFFWITSLLGIVAVTFLYVFYSRPNAVSLFDLATIILIFACIGTLHTYVIWRSATPGNLNFRSKLLYIIILPVTSIVTLPFFPLFFIERMILVAFIANCSYLLPFTVFHAWANYFNMQLQQIGIWQARDVRLSKENGRVFLNSTRVYFRYTDRRDNTLFTVPVVASSSTALGVLFLQTLTKQNEQLATVKLEDVHSFGWVFYTTGFKGLQRRYLNARISLADNKIDEDAVINIHQLEKAN